MRNFSRSETTKKMMKLGFGLGSCNKKCSDGNCANPVIEESRKRVERKRNVEGVDDDEEFLVEEYDSGDEGIDGGDLKRQAGDGCFSSSDDDREEEEQEKEEVSKVYFCSRTHSQLSQFVKELKRTTFASEMKVLCLGSRKNFCNNSVDFYGKDKNAHAVLPIKTDQDTLREGYRFIRSEEDDMDPSWEQRLVKRYYAKLFKEYCIADMSQYKTGKIGLRWRIEKEVISGKGQFICGNRKCNETDGLASYEVNFSYFEAGENKQALVKLVACKGCAEKLMYKRKKEKERLEKSETEKHKRKREKTRSDGSTDDEYDGSNERKRRGQKGSSSTNDETIDADNNFEEFLVGMFP